MMLLSVAPLAARLARTSRETFQIVSNVSRSPDAKGIADVEAFGRAIVLDDCHFWRLLNSDRASSRRRISCMSGLASIFCLSSFRLALPERQDNHRPRGHVAGTRQ
jgi:hypothetical protein